MAFEFKFPFEPPWEDLKQMTECPGIGTVYIFDSCVVTDPEERAKIDEEVAQILAQSKLKAYLAQMEKK